MWRKMKKNATGEKGGDNVEMGIKTNENTAGGNRDNAKLGIKMKKDRTGEKGDNAKLGIKMKENATGEKGGDDTKLGIKGRRRKK